MARGSKVAEVAVEVYLLSEIDPGGVCEGGLREKKKRCGGNENPRKHTIWTTERVLTGIAGSHDYR